jgi:hypothetical protein
MIDYKKIIQPENRGILLDVIVFFVNAVLMIVLSRTLANLLNQAKTDKVARWAVILFCLALSFLQPLGALLKRRRAHERNPDLAKPSPGCLFHPVIYFVSKLLFLITATALIVELVVGDNELERWLYITLFLCVPLLAVVNTAIVYFYFWKPKHAALLKFLQSKQAELMGDLLLFLNMICHQMFWGALVADLTKDYSGIGNRFFMFVLAALIIYFPPRLLYLAEDGHRRLTWLMMSLANTPVILRILFSRG